MPQLNRDELTKILRDTFHATVGAGVLTVQQLDQVRRQLAERLSWASTRSTSWSRSSRSR
jgi:hypothetical protein